jgi:HAD superfamily hydrolase (TIGR01549 family)
MHSRTLFKNQFLHFGPLKTEDEHDRFENAYTFADQEVIKKALVINLGLYAMNEVMCSLIGEKLDITNPKKIKDIARAITVEQSFYLKRNRSIFLKLQNQYKLGVVSNFSGNLRKIMDDFSLSSCFDFILDSYHEGITKPNPEIFKLAIAKCKCEYQDVFFVGDNLERDILPAKKFGMKTILISGNVNNSVADYTLSSLVELLPLILTISTKR